MRMSPSIRIVASLLCIRLVLLCGNATDAAPLDLVPTDTAELDTAPLDTANADVQLVNEATSILQLVSPVEASESCCQEQDRVYLLSTRHLTHNVCCASLQQVPFRMWRIDCGSTCCINPQEYEPSILAPRAMVIYIHGNQMPADEILPRASNIRRQIRSRYGAGSIDWIIFSWPSDKQHGILRDFREKADRCDAQGLYLASFMRKHVEASIPIAMIGYSFGARVATGALHALAGGSLAGRRLPEEPVTGANVRIGLVAPAIESNWLCRNGYHGRATKNMDRLLLLYNRRDAVLKRYWLIEKVRRETALGYSGPACFASRFDGTRLPVRSRDCSPSVKLRHSEMDYYENGCNAGCDMARLFNGFHRFDP